jgi:hypothetical protein
MGGLEIEMRYLWERRDNGGAERGLIPGGRFSRH